MIRREKRVYIADEGQPPLQNPWSLFVMEAEDPSLVDPNKLQCLPQFECLAHKLVGIMIVIWYRCIARSLQRKKNGCPRFPSHTIHPTPYTVPCSHGLSANQSSPNPYYSAIRASGQQKPTHDFVCGAHRGTDVALPPARPTRHVSLQHTSIIVF